MSLVVQQIAFLPHASQVDVSNPGKASFFLCAMVLPICFYSVLMLVLVLMLIPSLMAGVGDHVRRQHRKAGQLGRRSHRRC